MANIINSIDNATSNLFMPNSDHSQQVGVIFFNNVSFIANWGTLNTFIGATAGNPLLSTAYGNAALGDGTLQGLTTGANNIGIGSTAAANITSGNDNIAIGNDSLLNLITGQLNIALGESSGTNYTGAESSNILIGNAGVLGESNIIRLGTQGSGNGQQNTCYIAGITGVTVSNLAYVSIDTTTGQLGSTSAGTGLTFAADSGTATPSAGTITFAGAGTVTTSASGSTVTITGSGGGGLTWTVETGASVAMAVNNGYIANNAGTCVLTLPATAAVGSTIEVTGINNATGWQIAQNSGQTIHFGNVDTTTGTGGSLTSSATYDSIRIVNVVANTDWNVLSAVGNLTVV